MSALAVAERPAPLANWDGRRPTAALIRKLRRPPHRWSMGKIALELKVSPEYVRDCLHAPPRPTTRYRTCWL